MEKCRLCGESKELRESHIIPASVIRWELKTQNTYLRNPYTPNVRKQDGTKRPLLCDNCEEIFSKNETLFCNKIFYPRVRNNKLSFKYNSWLHYFIVSVLWRVLVIMREDKKSEISLHKEKLIQAENEWKNFLLKDQPILNFPNFHLMVIPKQKMPDKESIVDSKTGRKYMLDFDLRNYLMKSFDLDVLEFGQKRCVVYCKFNTFLLFAPITPFVENEWKHTQITNGKGMIIQPQETYDIVLWQNIIRRAVESIGLLRSTMSERQKINAMNHIEEFHRRNSSDEYR
jgi:hypothetical protein